MNIQMYIQNIKELHADPRYGELLELVGFPRSVLDVER